MVVVSVRMSVRVWRMAVSSMIGDVWGIWEGVKVVVGFLVMVWLDKSLYLGVSGEESLGLCWARTIPW